MPLNSSAADSSRATRGLLAERRDRAALRDATDALPLLVDVHIAAAMLDVSPRTIWRLAESGELTPVRIGRATRWVTVDVLAFVERLRERRAGQT